MSLYLAKSLPAVQLLQVQFHLLPLIPDPSVEGCFRKAIRIKLRAK